MDALILAAGLGTRLGAIGEHTPKALIEVGGITMLERTATRLVEAGADRLIVNVHHHADRIARFVETHDLGAEVVLSVEPERPLETGGGMVHARTLFRRNAPFFMHNVDVITDADLTTMMAVHEQRGALATLAVSHRQTSRHLLFDEGGLFGRSDARSAIRIEVRAPAGPAHALAFAGIHVASPELLELTAERGAFSILEPYLRLAGMGHRIDAFSIEGAMWLEIGTPERLEEARVALAGRG